ncbi:uncharacterized mitochondrial protein AtMg00860-like [Humulus lupulus]|uniref:uncharacterized mitochondrial protein AtMg00860-like n=1 Tax=Humulus lupulus TaxID=3486 RepID=UPI002B40475B|nr:uncharacterized mitochondrial protein AtMg00860-like [Humulus lupulus]
MDLMNRLFNDFLEKFVVVFIENTLIYSKFEAEHLILTLRRLQEHQLLAKFKKCEFWLEKVAFLGHIMSKDGVSMDPAKIEAMRDWPQPKNASEINSLLRLAGYYKRFFEGFSKIATHLTNLTRKQQKFVWTAQCEESFQSLKERLVFTLVLCVPIEEGKFEVYCDTSKNGLRCVLMQEDKVVPHEKTERV